MAFEKAEPHLANMAYSMIEEGMPLEVAKAYAVSKLGDESILYLGASASFLEVAEGTVRFYHQLIQEYFAAVLVQESSVVRLAPEQRWREVLAAASGMAADPDLFVRDVLAADAIAAAHCVTRGANVRGETIDRVVAAMLWDLDRMATLEASFADHMATNAFGSSGSVEMANDAMEMAVDKLSADVNLELAAAMRALGSAGIEALDRIGSEAAIRVRDYINDPRPHRTEGEHLMPRTFGNPYYSH